MKDTQINLRISEREKTAWQEAAERRGMVLAEFIRFCVRQKADIDEFMKGGTP